MRIIAGSLGGRIFPSPDSHRTHPMSDKMRGALFNMLGDVRGQSVLDPFAGSGALSFEAISRGARQALAIERDAAAGRAINEGITRLNLQGKVKLVKAPAGAWLRTTQDSFDVLLLDPPYDNLQLALIRALTTRLNHGGVVGLSWPGKQEPPVLESFKLRSRHIYGDGQLCLYEAQ